MKKRIYLDAAAAHPVRTKALRAFNRAVRAFGNPSAPHKEGQAARAILEDARLRIARMVGAKADAVVFTSGATESNALAIEGAVRALLEEGAQPESLEVLYSPAQHASVIGAVEAVEQLGVRVTPVPVLGGVIDIEAFFKLLTKATALVSLDAVCGETGTMYDTRALRRILDTHERNMGTRVLLHVDATQVPLIDTLDRTRLGADLISFDAQKIGGVRGIGALIVPSNVRLAPVMRGGGQEHGLRSGTPSPALATAFAIALERSCDERMKFSEQASRLTKFIAVQVPASISGAMVQGGEKQAPHIVNISFPGRDTDYLVALLDEAGFAVATRSACETDADGSRAVFAYTKDTVRSASTLRVSLHAKNTMTEVRAFVKALTRAVDFLDSMPGTTLPSRE